MFLHITWDDNASKNLQPCEQEDIERRLREAQQHSKNDGRIFYSPFCSKDCYAVRYVVNIEEVSRGNDSSKQFNLTVAVTALPGRLPIDYFANTKKYGERNSELPPIAGIAFSYNTLKHEEMGEPFVVLHARDEEGKVKEPHSMSITLTQGNRNSIRIRSITHKMDVFKSSWTPQAELATHEEIFLPCNSPNIPLSKCERLGVCSEISKNLKRLHNHNPRNSYYSKLFGAPLLDNSHATQKQQLLKQSCCS